MMRMCPICELWYEDEESQAEQPHMYCSRECEHVASQTSDDTALSSVRLQS